MKLTIGCFYYLLVGGFACSVLFFDPEWLCQINQEADYIWYNGMWHGFWGMAHFVRDFFTDTPCISHHGSTMYYVCYWLTFILSWVIGLIVNIIVFEKEK